MTNRRKSWLKLKRIKKKLKSKPCMDCSKKYPHYVMDFDHRKPTQKKFDVSDLRCGIKRLLAEIAKCDLVCANCHRERSHKRQK